MNASERESIGTGVDLKRKLVNLILMVRGGGNAHLHHIIRTSLMRDPKQFGKGSVIFDRKAGAPGAVLCRAQHRIDRVRCKRVRKTMGVEIDDHG